MSVQWTLVATFLYAELAVVVLLLLPFISARTWQKFFKSRFLKSLENQANLYFTVFIIILALLFVDSIREMSKYSSSKEHDSHGHMDAELQLSMKLFRAQRNFYIAGFALFLCLVIRRLVILISIQATSAAQVEALTKQAQGAAKHASDLMNKGATASASGGDTVKDNEGNKRKEQQEVELRKLREDLASAKEEMIRYRINCESMKKQAESVSEEYDRLMIEHERLQKEHSKLTNSQDVKKVK